MLDTVFGLPTHTILVHAVVVLVPVAALATIAVAMYPRWRTRFAGWLVLVNAATVVLTWITREAGKKLFERLDRVGGPRSPSTIARSACSWSGSCSCRSR